MIFGNVNNEFFATQCKLLPKPLAAALSFLKSTDLVNAKTGKFELKLGDSDCILQVLDLNTSPRESLRPEIHRKYIDVQFLAAGTEKAAFFNDDNTLEVDEDLLNTERDILFYKNSDTKESTIYFTVGTFACYFPWDVHVPAICVNEISSPIRKIVIKVPIKDCLE